MNQFEILNQTEEQIEELDILKEFMEYAVSYQKLENVIFNIIISNKGDGQVDYPISLCPLELLILLTLTTRLGLGQRTSGYRFCLGAVASIAQNLTCLGRNFSTGLFLVSCHVLTSNLFSYFT